MEEGRGGLAERELGSVEKRTDVLVAGSLPLNPRQML
jgi:hypothetical protein